MFNKRLKELEYKIEVIYNILRIKEEKSTWFNKSIISDIIENFEETEIRLKELESRFNIKFIENKTNFYEKAKKTNK